MIVRMLRENDVKRSNQIHTRPNQIMDRLLLCVEGVTSTCRRIPSLDSEAPNQIPETRLKWKRGEVTFERIWFLNMKIVFLNVTCPSSENAWQDYFSLGCSSSRTSVRVFERETFVHGSGVLLWAPGIVSCAAICVLRPAQPTNTYQHSVFQISPGRHP